MGLLDKLIGRKEQPSQGGLQYRLVGASCKDTVIVVGTEYRQAVVDAAARQMSGGEVLALLRAEPSNPHDAHAVRVELLGQVVGYLSSFQARKYEPAIALAAQHGELVAARAFAFDHAGSTALKLCLPAPAVVLRELGGAYGAM